MKMTRYLSTVHWHALMVPAAVLAATVIAGLALKRLVFGALHRWAQQWSARFDEVVIGPLEGSFMLWMLMLGIHLAARSSRLPERVADDVSQTVLILWIISLVVAAARATDGLVKYSGAGALPVTTISRNLARLIVLLLGIIIVLNVLGISVTPLLTALGVGGLAVALALQDTLSNLFAGLYISLAGQIRLGDYVKLNTGEEGYVADITWRSTTFRALAHNLVVVPNSKLAQAIVTNYSLPERRMAVSIPVGVSYDCDPDEVERLLLEVAVGGVGDIPGLLDDPAPVVRFNPGFGDSSLNFTLVFHVAEFSEQYRVQHELRKRILKRFRAAQIEIPFPTRTVHVKELPELRMAGAQDGRTPASPDQPDGAA
ncbi:MAG TPA: mechanosensitive ion channel family protein [Vicinamibacterales bacterium]|nr:mechanosensitive ion channel family protein [Vicinamibacterales bacterium]